MNNVAIHHNQIGQSIQKINKDSNLKQCIYQVYNNVCICIQFLSSYSLDFNLIKEFFLVLKVWLKHHYIEANSTAEDFDCFFEHDVQECLKLSITKGHFKSTGIRMCWSTQIYTMRPQKPVRNQSMAARKMIEKAVRWREASAGIIINSIP